jgi:hypothetical protein
LGLEEKGKELEGLYRVFSVVKKRPGPMPKGYKPQVEVKKLPGGVHLTLDDRAAGRVREVFEHTQRLHQALRFHFYSIVAVSIWGAFETYVEILLYELYRKCPEILKSKEVVTFMEVVDHRSSVLDLIIEKQLDRVGHFVVDELLEYLEKRLGLTVAGSARVRLREYYLVRNIIAHSTGLVRPAKLPKLPTGIAVVHGEVRVNRLYLLGMLARLESVVRGIERKVIRKFAL